MKLEHWNYPQKTTTHAKLVFDRTTWVVWANTQFATVWFLCLSLFFCLFVTRTGTSGPILTIYTSYNVFLRKHVHFGFFITPHSGIQMPPKSPKKQKRAWTGIFKPNLHIIETSAPNPTKVCTVTKTIKCSSWVVQNRVKQSQYGGRPPFKK